MMAPHQERVVAEKRELDIKISALRAFSANVPVFAALKFWQQDLLERQLKIMVNYSAILGERIAAFEVTS